MCFCATAFIIQKPCCTIFVFSVGGTMYAYTKNGFNFFSSNEGAQHCIKWHFGKVLPVINQNKAYVIKARYAGRNITVNNYFPFEVQGIVKMLRDNQSLFGAF